MFFLHHHFADPRTSGLRLNTTLSKYSLEMASVTVTLKLLPLHQSELCHLFKYLENRRKCHGISRERPKCIMCNYQGLMHDDSDQLRKYQEHVLMHLNESGK